MFREIGISGLDLLPTRRRRPVMDAARLAELRERYPGCPTGSAVITAGGNLPARFVVHAVGPVWQGGGHDEALSR